MLQDQVEPGPVEDVAEVLQRELGAPPSHLFAEFEPEARAAASLAQVCPHTNKNPDCVSAATVIYDC